MEMLDTFTRDGKFLGVKSRKELHNGKDPGCYHKPAWSWIYNSKGEILVQKRSKLKKFYPGYYDMSVAGHVDAGERIVDGLIREVKEEIGVDVTEEECHFEFEYIEDKVHEIGQLYTIKIDKEENEFDIQKEEVDFVKWVTFEDFKNMFWSDNWAPYSDDFKNKTIKVLEKRIRG